MIGISALLAGLLCGCGIYLFFSRNLQRIAIGFLLLSNGVNLVVLTAAGIPVGALPPILVQDKPSPLADPLPQAFILTAIVIGLGMAAFLLAMAARFHRQSDRDTLDETEGK